MAEWRLEHAAARHHPGSNDTSSAATASARSNRQSLSKRPTVLDQHERDLLHGHGVHGGGNVRVCRGAGARHLLSVLFKLGRRVAGGQRERALKLTR